MTRMHPKVSRQAILLYCEGAHDAAFMKCLYDYFHRERTDRAVQIVMGKGGTLLEIINEASKRIEDYLHKVVIVDYDKPPEEIKNAKNLSKIKGVIICSNNPSMDWHLLVFAGEKDTSIPKGTGGCKKIFVKKYSKNKSRTDKKTYAEIFSKTKLIKIAQKNKHLATLISLVRGRLGDLEKK